jgi:cytochrome d ubiquinol oxidase subunit II
LTPWLPVALGLAIAFAVAMYVIADGLDLGVGILLPFARGEPLRAAMINTIAPFWDGNETWLVLGGTLLIAAFPLAYATLLPAFYLPLIAMLLALVFRGVAFELRFRAERLRGAWDGAFAGGSLIAALAQGMMLGGFLQGVRMADGGFAGGPLDFISPFALLCGAGLVCGYALLGAGWLILKARGATALFGRAAARLALPATLAFIAAVSLWTPLQFPRIAHRWFGWPNIAFLSPAPLATAAVALVAWRAIGGARDALPFLLGIALFLLAFLGLGVSLWPYAIPWRATLWQAASSPPTQAFVGVGVAVILPLVLGYFAFAHWVFRGKIDCEVGYDHEA